MTAWIMTWSQHNRRNNFRDSPLKTLITVSLGFNFKIGPFMHSDMAHNYLLVYNQLLEQASSVWQLQKHTKGRRLI